MSWAFKVVTFCISEETLEYFEIEMPYPSAVVKRELSVKAMLFIYWSVVVPTLIYAHQVKVMTGRLRSRIQVMGMSFLQTMSGLNLKDRVGSSVI